MESEIFSKAANLRSSLLSAWKANPRQLDKIEEILNELKPLLLQLHYLPYAGEPTPDEAYLLLARDVLEIGALWSIEKENDVLFERYMSQLKSYYYDYKNILKESMYTYNLLGLNLLHLLAQNRLAEFHTELELLPVEKFSDEKVSNVYISYPVSLEQYLMEGSYHKVFLSKDSLPAPNYRFFVNVLMETIREEIATCAETAYDKISVTEAAKVLGLDTQEQLDAFQAKKQWRLEETGQFFVFSSGDKQAEEAHFIKSGPLILQTLHYAKELEKIV
ncbi:26S proteasome non-ATPase regulatory subunit 8-like [Dysidea avara]|uniref:26S proteasome non-ATPase regulatory subunit 8-like n=1 Tax=Dysidea avara TaxID=196820 RepID=UPI00331E31F9